MDYHRNWLNISEGLIMILFTDAETGNEVYINPDCVKMVRDFRNVTKIMFLDDAYVIVTDTLKVTIEKMVKKPVKS